LKAGRNRLFSINKKYLRIAIAALVAVIAIVVIALVVSSNNEIEKKQSAVNDVVKTGVINIGLRGDIGVLCSYDEKTGLYSGLEKDIADELVKRLFPDGGMIVNFVEVNSETKDAMLQQDTLDISLGASVKGSASGIKYTDSYYSDGTAFLVMEGSMTSQDGLTQGKIAVVQGTYPAAKEKKGSKLTNLDVYLTDNKIGAFVKVYASYPEAVDALRDGFVKGVCANEINLKLYGKAGMLILPERFMPVNYCVEVRGKLGGFYDAVNDCIAGMKRDGTMEALIAKYSLVNYSVLAG
jgi:putative glutamine transport system substrate-binding protein